MTKLVQIMYSRRSTQKFPDLLIYVYDPIAEPNQSNPPFTAANFNS